MENLQPKESLAIIEQIIQLRKQKYEENGTFFIFWGILIIVASLGHFLMLQLEVFVQKSGYIWLILMPLGFVFTFLVKMKQGIKVQKEQKYTDWQDYIWLVVGTLPFISVYLMPSQYLTMAIYLPFCLVCLAMALRFKMKLWIFNSLISIVLCYASVFAHFYQLLLVAVIAFLIFLIPGIQFFMDFKRRGSSR